MTFEVVDPESGVCIDQVSYYPGWGGDGTTPEQILTPFKKFKCDKVRIKEYW